jgi:translation initiation factor IF-3
LGILKREDALKLAKPEEKIDLIEISPNANPPVARLMSYDKYRYEEEKREKKEKLAQKSVAMKQVQISARAAKNDLLMKANQAEKFLKEGRNVEIMMRLRGREKANKQWVLQKLDEFISMIKIDFKKISEPKFGGRGISMQIVKK